MKTDIRLRGDQPDRLRIGDEMDLVPSLRELDAKLSGHNAAAAVRRITGDTDLHEGLFGDDDWMRTRRVRFTIADTRSALLPDQQGSCARRQTSAPRA